MTQEEKELLIKDISARLPYHPIVHIHDIDVIDYDNYLYPDYIEKMMSGSIRLKPYLRPMSSMTDKDLIEFLQINGMNLNSDELKTFRRGQTTIVSTLSSYSRHIDWLNAHHFDYRGLIEKGLAIDATELNIY